MKVDKIMRLTDTARGGNDPLSVGPVVLAILSVKYLEDKYADRIDEKATLSYLIKDPSNTLKNLMKSFDLIKSEFPELKGVYEGLGVNWDAFDGRTIFEIMMTIHKEHSTNYIEAVYEVRNLMMKTAGKTGGEGMSPHSLNELLITLLNIQQGHSFYDGTAGQGGTLLEVVRQHRDKKVSLNGQEFNTQHWASGKLALLLAGGEDVHFLLGNTLTAPQFIEENRVEKFDYIAMVPPFSLKLNGSQHNELMNDLFNRFSLGDLPKTNADMAFILHALSSMSGQGRAVLVVSNGVLFRGGMENSIRQNLIDTDQIEAVISLAPNILHTTSIPINLLVLNKNKPSAKQKKIQFIQANELYEEQNRSRFMNREHIERIHNVLDEAREEEGFSKLVPIDEIEGTLSVDSYVHNREIEVEGEGVYRIHVEHISKDTECLLEVQEFADVYRGLNITSKTGEESADGKYRLIKLSDVQDGEIIWDGLKPFMMKTNFKPGLYEVQEGDVIISSRGSNIKVAVVPPHEDTVLLSQSFLGIRLKKGKVNPDFLQLYFESPVGQYQLTDLMKGTTVLSLNPKSLSSLQIVVPSIEDQQAIAAQYKTSKESYKRQLIEARQKFSSEKDEVYERMGILEAFELIESKN